MNWTQALCIIFALINFSCQSTALTSAKLYLQQGKPEEAKALWETLRTTVGSDNNRKKGPQSLSESVNRRSNLSSMLPRRNNVQTKQEDTFSERMRKLAGIK